jgi:hypothetical protein
MKDSLKFHLRVSFEGFIQEFIEAFFRVSVLGFQFRISFHDFKTFKWVPLGFHLGCH